jgi:hypothetical protein
MADKDKDVVRTRTASDQAGDTAELLAALKEVARASTARDPMGHAAPAWRRVLVVLERMSPDPVPEPEAQPEPKGRDR